MPLNLGNPFCFLAFGFSNQTVVGRVGVPEEKIHRLFQWALHILKQNLLLPDTINNMRRTKVG